MTLDSVLTSVLLVLLCFHEYVWKEKQIECFLHYTALRKIDLFSGSVSPRASSSVRASVMYLKSMHEITCLGF